MVSLEDRTGKILILEADRDDDDDDDDDDDGPVVLIDR
jgi:hypothetical protein